MLGFALLLTVAATAALPRPHIPQHPDLTDLRLVHLDLALEPDYVEGRLQGVATLVVANMSAEPVSLIPLLLYRLMTVSEVTDASGGALPFTQDIVTIVDWPQYQANHITVILDVPLDPGQETTVRVFYSGYLAGLTETGMRYVKDRIDRDFTIIRADALAFPVLGVPSWEQNRAASHGPFTFRARITVPEDLTVAAGGRLVERVVEDGRATFEYQNTLPVDFLNITIAPYRVLTGRHATVFCFPADSAGARRLQDRLEAALAQLGQWFGPLDSDAGLTVIEIPEGFGSQASLAAGIIQTRDAFNDSTQYRQLYHELSHLWDVPDLEAPSPRWNEGMASFLERRLAAELDGGPDVRVVMEEAAQAIVRRFDQDSSYQTTPLAEYGRASLTDLSYRVGMLAFYSLFEVIGPQAFDAAIATFRRRYRGSGATLAELVATVQQATPDRDLTSIFDDWIYSTEWSRRLGSEGSLRRLIDGYRSP